VGRSVCASAFVRVGGRSGDDGTDGATRNRDFFFKNPDLGLALCCSDLRNFLKARRDLANRTQLNPKWARKRFTVWFLGR
jgi:hypothetical protein